MGIEVEKKYRMTTQQRERVLEKLRAANARFVKEDFETNTIFTGGALSVKQSILRLRTTADKTVLTYKESLPGDASVKRRVEHETTIENGSAMNEIVLSLGYKPHLIYEKRRQTWHFETVEITVDDLPFGFYLEIEGEEAAILDAETKLELTDLIAEHESYPALTRQFGTPQNDLIAARFEPEKV